MGVSWIYNLKKEQLIAELDARQIDSAGSLTDLRQRFVQYVRSHPAEFPSQSSDPPEYNEELDQTRDKEELARELDSLTIDRPLPPVILPQSAPIMQPIVTMETPTVMDQMRKWGCHFDGRNVYSFLERIEELRTAYQLSEEQLLRGFPELLKGDAQLCYRNIATDVRTWPELKETLINFYLAPGERRNLDKQISNRCQGEKESIRAYATALTTLMRRRGGISKEQQIENLHFNMKAQLRLYIRLHEIKDVCSLMQRVEEIEKVLKQTASHISHPSSAPKIKNPRPMMSVQAPYDRRICCWRCKERGHDRFNCKTQRGNFVLDVEEMVYGLVTVPAQARETILGPGNHRPPPGPKNKR